MKEVSWTREALLPEVAENFWRYLSPDSKPTEAAAEAAALLDMPLAAVRELAYIHFVNSPEVERMLREMPQLMRSLATATRREADDDPERFAGAPLWGRTVAMQATTGLDFAVVTAPARRSYDTAENRLLRFCLAEIARAAATTRWFRDNAGGRAAEVVISRGMEADRLTKKRALIDVRPVPPSRREVRRVMRGRRRLRYAAVLDVYRLRERLLGRFDRESLREIVEERGLAVARRSKLLELLVAFRVMESLEGSGWTLGHLGLVHVGELRISGTRDGVDLHLSVEHVPSELRAGSRYMEVLGAHGAISVQPLRPDLVIELVVAGESRWLMIEVKGGGVSVSELMRRAVVDLLAYRRDFHQVLDEGTSPYGLGVVWGKGLKAASSEIGVCTVDKVAMSITGAIDQVLA